MTYFVNKCNCTQIMLMKEATLMHEGNAIPTMKDFPQIKLMYQSSIKILYSCSSPQITYWCCIGIMFWITPSFIAPIKAIWVTVTKQLGFKTCSISTSSFVYWTNWFFCVEKRFWCCYFSCNIAIVHIIL